MSAKLIANGHVQIYINTQNMASDLTQVLNAIAKYNYNTFIHTHKKKKLQHNSTCIQL